MEQIKVLRKKLDGFSQVVERLRPIKSFGVSASLKDLNSDKRLFEVNGYPEQHNSDEIKRCYNNLVLAKAWTGKMLGYLTGEGSPYVNDGNRNTVKDIEPTNDKVDINAWEERNKWNTLNHIQKVDFIRQQLQELGDIISGFFPPFKEEIPMSVEDSRNLAICRTNIYNHILEARFQMGFELARIKQAEEIGDKDIDQMTYGGIKQR